jgi:hypothetical protein
VHPRRAAVAVATLASAQIRPALLLHWDAQPVYRSARSALTDVFVTDLSNTLMRMV